MRIAQIAPVIERVPPKKYGGTERVVSALTEELVKRGHKVTLFASGDSLTSAKLVSVYPKALREVKLGDLYGSNVFTMLNIGLAYSRQSEFDIIHDHVGHLSLPTANLAITPTVMTAHGIFTAENEKIYESLRNVPLITISRSQAKSTPSLNHLATVYNGLPMEHYPFSDKNDGYLLFVGRISYEKGVHQAITVAEILQLPLIIAAKLDDVDVPYFNEYIAPKLSGSIRWIGEVDEIQRNKLYSKALCTLHPITWKEPFGLVMIEAMACGSPVVGFDLGSVPEIIADGKTGFVVQKVEEMIQAVSQIKKIDRHFCRQYALTKFSVKKMAEGYEAAYQKMLQKQLQPARNSELKHFSAPFL